ncbi:hypothetical protein TNCV_132221 [Trichonephila clavipes]|nr:hypothetical protein TNCV_132221 [Trichonephila clavipes]
MLESGLQRAATVVVLLRAERAAVFCIVRGRPGTGLLDTESSVGIDPKVAEQHYEIIETSATSACDNPISIHPTARHLNELGKRRLGDIFKLY